MKRLLYWLYLLVKRQLKNPVIVVVLIAMPVAALIVTNTASLKEKEPVRVGIVLEDDDKIAIMTRDYLVNGDYSVQFYEAESQEKLEQEEAAKEAKRRKVRIIIGGVVAAAIAIVIIVTQIIIPSANYSKAAELQAAGDYDAAIAMYAELGDFKDSADLKAQAEAKKRELEEEKQKLLKAQAYADAEALLINNDFDGAIEEFKKISGYKDADERVLEAYYQKADSLQSAGNDKAAAIAFGSFSGFERLIVTSSVPYSVSVVHFISFFMRCLLI